MRHEGTNGRRKHEGKRGKDMDFFEWREKRGETAHPEAERYGNLAIGAAIEVHKRLGPGHSEGVYLQAMCHELDLRGIPHEREVTFDVVYKGRIVGRGRIDLLVGGCVVLELKAVERLCEVHRAQAIAYLVAKSLRLAILIN